MLRLGQGPFCHQRWHHDHKLMKQGEKHLVIFALAFCLTPLLPNVTNKGVLPYLLTPPYACTLKQLCSDTLVGGSSSKSTHSLFPDPLLDIQKCLWSVTTILCHDFRTHCLAKHSRARMCLSVSERRFLGLSWRAKYLFMYHWTVSTLTVTPSLRCNILASWGHKSPRFTPFFRSRRVASLDAKGARGLPALGISSNVPVAIARRHHFSTTLTVALHSCAALRALPSRSNSWTRRQRLANTHEEGGILRNGGILQLPSLRYDNFLRTLPPL
jgi:hypothetical protein